MSFETFQLKGQISTHTLTWSVTFPPPYPAVDSRDFNSHAHVERDGSFFSYRNENRNFNSHAHVERDRFSYYRVEEKLNFNSHAHVERDEKVKIIVFHFRISTHTLTWSVTEGVQ